MKPDKKTIAAIAAGGMLLALIGSVLYSQRGDRLFKRGYAPVDGIMNTTMNVTLVVGADTVGSADAIAEKAIRQAALVTEYMNRYDPASEISAFNAAAANTKIHLHPQTMTVLKKAREIYGQSDGAFDITVLPLIDLWKYLAAQKENARIPNRLELGTARRRSQWEHITLAEDHAVKSAGSAAVDLGGIAKGYAIDLVSGALREEGCAGGVVDIGGDVRCFGKKPDGMPWIVSVRSPFPELTNSTDREINLCVLHVRDKAVCTSGNYERPIIIGGRKYNHIFDPRTGEPCGGCVSATVIAPDAATADAWATALSVLGPAGFGKLKGTGIEALLVTGDEYDFSVEMTGGFKAFLYYENPLFFENNALRRHIEPEPGTTRDKPERDRERGKNTN